MKNLVIVILVLVIIGMGYYWICQQGNQPDKLSKSPNSVTQSTNPTQNHRQFSAEDVAAAKDAATNFFQACSAGDWDKAKTYCPYIDKINDALNQASKSLEGLEIINIGEPYKKNASYPGLFIPYEIKIKSGETQKSDLAVRNDNPAKAWKVDGGI
jgi:hypothetical protein